MAMKNHYRVTIWTTNDGFDMREALTLDAALSFVREAMAWPHFAKAEVRPPA
jgi:hypothetical protein